MRQRYHQKVCQSARQTLNPKYHQQGQQRPRKQVAPTQTPERPTKDYAPEGGPALGFREGPVLGMVQAICFCSIFWHTLEGLLWACLGGGPQVPGPRSRVRGPDPGPRVPVPGPRSPGPRPRAVARRINNYRNNFSGNVILNAARVPSEIADVGADFTSECDKRLVPSRTVLFQIWV